MKKRLLFISTIFPSAVANKHATYSVQLLSALTEYYDIDIINPISWLQRLADNIANVEILDGMEIYHPTYWYTPGLLRHRYGSFYFASVKNRAYRLIKGRSYDVILASWLYPDGWAAAKIAKKWGIPLYIMALGTDANRLIPQSKVARQTVDAITQAEKTICMSHAMKGKLIAVGAEADKLIVMYNGVQRSIFHTIGKDNARKELGLSVIGSLILFVGNLLKTKGLDELSDAFAILCKNDRFKDARLLIAGAGKYEDKFKKRIASNGLTDRTVFMGSCSLNVVAKLMNATDVVCLPSYSEGLPNVVLEALCCNAKVVATDVGGIPELQNIHKNLYLVPPKDARKLADTLVTALNAVCYEDKADDIYSWKAQAEKIAALMMK